MRVHIDKMAIWGILLFLGMTGLKAQGLSGMTGLFNVPTARMQADSVIMLGAHFMDREYGAYKYNSDPEFAWDALATFATVSFLPWVEAQFRYTHLLGREIRQEVQGESYFPDRMVSARVQVFREGTGWRPSVVLGLEDLASVIGGNSPSYFSSSYIVLSKEFSLGSWRADASLGYAVDPGILPWVERRPERLVNDGPFGGVALGHDALPGTDLILEYDSYRFNLAGRVLILRQVQILAGLYELKAFGGGLTWRIRL